MPTKNPFERIVKRAISGISGRSRTSGDRTVIDEMNELIAEAKEDRENIETIWDRSWDYYNGEQWEDVDKTKFDPIWTKEEVITLNLIKPSVNTMLAIILDQDPIWYVVPVDDTAQNAEGTEDAAAKLESWLQAFWYQQELYRHIKLAWKDALVIGTGILKIFWNGLDTRNASLTGQPGTAGLPDVSWISPYDVFPDPACTAMEDGNYLLIRHAQSEAELKVLYPDTFKLEGLQVEDLENRTGLYARNSSAGKGTQLYEVWECYHERGTKLTILSGDVVFYDDFNPLPEGRYPVVVFSNDERGTDKYGVGEAENMRGLQNALNKLLWRILVHTRVTSNPRLIAYGGVENPITNRPGEVIKAAIGGKLEALYPPPLPEHVFGLLQTLFMQFDTVSGVQDVTQGRRPVGVQAGVAIQELQEASQTKMRMMIREWTKILAKVGQLVISWLQAAGSGTYNMTMMDSRGPRSITLGPSDMFDLSTQEMAPRDFRVVVQPQVELPLSQAGRAELAIQLNAIRDETGAPLIDREATLEMVKFPGRFAMLTRMQKKALAAIEKQQEYQMSQYAAGQGVNPATGAVETIPGEQGEMPIA